MREPLRAFREVFGNPGLRRLQLAWAGSNIGSWAYAVAIAVYAYGRHGAYAVGLLAFLRWVGAGVAAPFSGVLGDRFPRVRVMVASDVLRAALLVSMAVLVAGGFSPFLVYGLSIAATIVGTAFRPAQAALVPSLARSPQELTAANVTASSTESVGIFLGPALGGLSVAAAGVEATFLLTAGLFVWSAVLVGLIRERPREAAEHAEPEGLLRESLAGFRAITASRPLTLLAVLFAAQTFVDGALGVLTVVIALETLARDAAFLGFLNSAAGAGGIVGGLLAAALVGRQRLAANFNVGLVLWGAPLVVLGLLVHPLLALVAFALVGIGNTIIDVAGDTLIQRVVPERVLARAFGALESLILVSVALGALAAPVLIDLVGDRAALVAVGAILPVCALFSWRPLVALDRVAAPVGPVELLRRTPLFAPLDPPTLEYLASQLEERRLRGGETLFEQGDPGDRVYIVEDGRLAVVVDGRDAGEVGPGDIVGEIALLRDVPRTATVRALTDARLWSLDRETFVTAVAGHRETAVAADALIAARLGRLRPAILPTGLGPPT